MVKTPNWQDLQIKNQCGACVYYEPTTKNGKLTARGHCTVKNKYKQRTERCLNYKGD